VLELGCGDGGNLLPMACVLPGSSFTGIDRSGAAIARGAATAGELALANVELLEGDLTALPAALGAFDYVVAHGVYSWIGPAARERLLEACRTHLAPHGVAYVSYDALPGGYLREVTRRMLRWHLRGVADPWERIESARALLAAVATAGEHGGPVQRTLAEQAGRALEQRDPSLFHDELAEEHEAFLFADFAADAGRHGLRYLAEADVFEMQAGVLPDVVARSLAELGDDLIAREQYLDFFKGRMFRQTLLCHAAVERREPEPALVAGMLAATPARAVGEPGEGRVEFRGPGGAALTTDLALAKTAMLRLGEAWPRALPVSALTRSAPPGDAQALHEVLLRAYAANLVQLHVWAPELPAAPSERPVAFALARLQAARGTHVTNLRHSTVEITDERGRRLITLLDGTRDRAALLRELHRPADELERSLAGLAAVALLES
jgi:SAM-dependent methyltransferase